MALVPIPNSHSVALAWVSPTQGMGEPRGPTGWCNGAHMHSRQMWQGHLAFGRTVLWLPSGLPGQCLVFPDH